ncbi:MAG: 3-phosphoshikimate 1-carboxyvinyltransferase [Kangiellaceae bacterium]|jgi:3-phosphoshikimate 1-carboxyvinyltransferase|nr:3-phosphoshikimate 1-carboxyvinyltransferase [Kangiellaceae bacterium]
MKRRIAPAQRVSGEISLAGSKYLANRLVIIAALAEQAVLLDNVVENDDINTAIEGLNKLGYRMTRHNTQLSSEPRPADFLAKPISLYTSHSGTFSRFVAAVSSIQVSVISVTGSDKMNTRPMAELFAALRQLGVQIKSSDNDTLPAKINGPWRHNQCQIDASKSSQYVSALLLVAPVLGQDTTIELVGEKVSTDYIDMTVALMRQFGAQVEKRDNSYFIPAQRGYCPPDSQSAFTIAPDPVSSSYFMAAVAICSGELLLATYDFESLQGEAQFYRVLQEMGCDITRHNQGMQIRRVGRLRAVDKDMGAMPDVVQTMAAVACFAEGTTVMRNIAHLAYKESDRIKDTATELRKLGIAVDYGSDYLAVTGDPHLAAMTPATLDTYDDHRMAMSLALIGGRFPGVVIDNADVVSKSFPDYFVKLQQIGIRSELVS